MPPCSATPCPPPLVLHLSTFLAASEQFLGRGLRELVLKSGTSWLVSNSSQPDRLEEGWENRWFLLVPPHSPDTLWEDMQTGSEVLDILVRAQ